MRPSTFVPAGVGAVVGAAGGGVFHALGYATLLPGMILGGLFGLLFALLVGRRASGPGAGLLWGLAFFLLLWLAGPPAPGRDPAAARSRAGKRPVRGNGPAPFRSCRTQPHG